MPLIRQTIPNLVGGVSQQPDAMRLEGQCSEQINAYSDPVNGLRKRPRVDFLRKHDITVTDDDACHFIKRTEDERYVVVTSENKLRVYDLDTGLEAKIQAEDGTEYTTGLPITSSDYLYPEVNYRDDLRFLTVGDSTYVLNQGQVVEGDSDYAENGTDYDNPEYFTADEEEEALVFIKQGAHDTAYGVFIDHNDDTTVGTPVQAQITVPFQKIYGKFKGRSIVRGHNLGNNGVCTIVNGGAGYEQGKELVIRVGHKGGPTIHRASNGGITYTTDSSGAITFLKINFTGGSYRKWGSNDNPPVVEFFSGPNNPNFTQSKIDTFYRSHHTGDAATRGTSSPYGTLTSTATNLITEKIATNMVANSQMIVEGGTANSNTRFTVQRLGNIIKIKQHANAPTNFKWAIKSEDGLANEGLQVIYKEVASITDLPLQCYDNFKIKVAGDESAADDYYVIFKTINGETFGDGYWQETLGFKEQLRMSNTTLPHVLSLLSVGETSSDPPTFKFAPLQLENRLVGDQKSNPFPSFLGKRITNLFFFKNRLGFMTEDKVVMTEYGLGKVINNTIFYNFSRTTVQTFVDTDPIDITIATDRVTNLQSSAIFQDKLILFSENTQFSLDTGGDVLAPTTVSVAPITEFNAASSVNPIVVGDSVYFSIDKNNSLELREYKINKNTESFESYAVTNQIPTYIPNGIRDFAFTATQNMICLTAGTDLKTLYVYKFLHAVDGTKVQSAWSKFTFPFDIHGINFNKDVLTILFKYTATPDTNDCLMQGTMNFDNSDEEPSTLSSNIDYKSLVDFAFQGSMTGGTTSTVTIPFPTAGLTLASDGSDFEMNDEEYISLTGYSSTNNQVSFSHINGATTTVTIGLKYTMTYTFSEFVIKQKSEKFQTAVNLDHKLKNIAIHYTDTKGDDNKAKFELEVDSPLGSLQTDDTGTSSHTTTFGIEEYREFDPVDGFFAVPLFFSSEDVVISLKQPYKYPANFQNVNVESIVRDRARAY